MGHLLAATSGAGAGVSVHRVHRLLLHLHARRLGHLQEGRDRSANRPGPPSSPSTTSSCCCGSPDGRPAWAWFLLLVFVPFIGSIGLLGDLDHRAQRRLEELRTRCRLHRRTGPVVGHLLVHPVARTEHVPRPGRARPERRGTFGGGGGGYGNQVPGPGLPAPTRAIRNPGLLRRPGTPPPPAGYPPRPARPAYLPPPRHRASAPPPPGSDAPPPQYPAPPPPPPPGGCSPDGAGPGGGSARARLQPRVHQPGRCTVQRLEDGAGPVRRADAGSSSTATLAPAPRDGLRRSMLSVWAAGAWTGWSK